jgi:SAM-dependent methyltransferase
MLKSEAWQLTNDSAVAYERDFVPAMMAQWPTVLADIAGIRDGDRVLDVACGTGIFARHAAERAGSSGQVTGLDLNEGMLAVARRLRPELEWRQGDAAKLPFADGAFDVAASQMAFMFFPDPVAALREMWRVLAPGGRLAVLVCGPMGPDYAMLTDILRSNVGDSAAAMIASYFALGDKPILLRLFEEADIPGAQSVLRQGFACFSSIDEYIRIEIKGSPLAGLVDDDAYRRIRSEALSAFGDVCDPFGRIAFSLDARIVSAAKNSRQGGTSS